MKTIKLIDAIALSELERSVDLNRGTDERRFKKYGIKYREYLNLVEIEENPRKQVYNYPYRVRRDILAEILL